MRGARAAAEAVVAEAAAGEGRGAGVPPALFLPEHTLPAQRARSLGHLRRTLRPDHLPVPWVLEGAPSPCVPPLLCLELLWVWGWLGSGPCCTPPSPLAPPQCRAHAPGPLIPHPKPCGVGTCLVLSGLRAFIWSHPARPGGPPHLSDTGLGHQLPLCGLEGTLGVPKAQSWHRAGVGRPWAPPFHSVCTALLPLLWPVSAHGSSGSWEFLLLVRQALQRLWGLNQ